MPPVGFESTISAGERPQTLALGRAGTGTGKNVTITYRNLKLTAVRSVDSSAIFVRNGVVQTTLPTHEVRTCGNIF